MGGAELAVERLSTELVRRGHDVTVYCREGRRLITDTSYRGVQLVTLPCLNSQHSEAISHTALGAFYASLAPRSRHGRPDLLHIHATGPALLSGLPRLAGIHTVVTVQGLDWRREKWGALARRVLKAGAWCSANLPNETIVVAKFLQRHFEEHYGRQTTYIPNGVDMPTLAEPGPLMRRLGIEPRKYVLFLARLVPEKGIHTLIDAFKRVPGDWTLIIAGESSFTDEYVEDLHNLAAEDSRVKLVGGLYGDDKAEAFSNAGLFVLPSTIEGLSLALLEAMSYGLHPLTSDIPENADVVVPAGGTTFKVGDAGDLAEKLRVLLAQPERLLGQASAIREHVAANYAWSSIAEQTERVYARCVR